RHDSRTGEELQSESISDEGLKKDGNFFVLADHPEIRISARSFKMSKSRGNVINPDDIVHEYGADSLRLYEMFMGPLEQVKPWSMHGVEGVYRFLNRVWRLMMTEDGASVLPVVREGEATPQQLRDLHATIKKVTEDIESMAFNTAISTLMIFLNQAQGWESLPRSVMEKFVLLLSPFAPHLAEELWEKLGHSKSMAYEPWPEVDPQYLIKDTLELAVQVNGKVRGRVSVPSGATQESVLAAARQDPSVASYLAGKAVKKEIYVPGRLVSFVVG
ncbi:MAG: class I tRNA ligase family protein, partial [Lentisphaerota bacterium]